MLQAQEDNEMSLVEGEVIEQIEQLDEGWWSGVGANGTKSGLFPGTSRTEQSSLGILKQFCQQPTMSR